MTTTKYKLSDFGPINGYTLYQAIGRIPTDDLIAEIHSHNTTIGKLMNELDHTKYDHVYSHLWDWVMELTDEMLKDIMTDSFVCKENFNYFNKYSKQILMDLNIPPVKNTLYVALNAYPIDETLFFYCLRNGIEITEDVLGMYAHKPNARDLLLANAPKGITFDDGCLMNVLWKWEFESSKEQKLSNLKFLLDYGCDLNKVDFDYELEDNPRYQLGLKMFTKYHLSLEEIIEMYESMDSELSYVLPDSNRRSSLIQINSDEIDEIIQIFRDHNVDDMKLLQLVSLFDE